MGDREVEEGNPSLVPTREWVNGNKTWTTFCSKVEDVLIHTDLFHVRFLSRDVEGPVPVTYVRTGPLKCVEIPSFSWDRPDNPPERLYCKNYDDQVSRNQVQEVRIFKGK